MTTLQIGLDSGNNIAYYVLISEWRSERIIQTGLPSKMSKKYVIFLSQNSIIDKLENIIICF